MDTAHFWESFKRLAGWSLEALGLPPVLLLTAVFGLILIAAVMHDKPFRKGACRRSNWLVLTQLVFFPLTVAVGALFPASGAGPYAKPNVWGGRLLDASFYLSLASACFWVYRMKGLRWFAIGLIALQEVFVLCAGFVAGMSVSGSWL
jgi:hypothetical protein